MRAVTLRRLRVHAISQSLFPSTTLSAAIAQLGFIQADPIRSPARAQDLILRHRVDGYRAGDLERHYPSLDLEEDVVYAYGFVSREVWRLLHPRAPRALSALEKRVLDQVRSLGVVHPRDLEGKSVTNAWGGQSKATTRALDHLHYRGLLRIARRDNGIRVYQTAAPIPESTDRARQLAMRVATILAPAPDKSLQATLARMLGKLPRGPSAKQVLADLIRSGALEKQTVDGVSYVWPGGVSIDEDAPRRVRLLAPFDPLIWDRSRFEHFWGWAYRFEAYTPPAKRVRGYYALPLLWGDRIIGWANAKRVESGVDIELGFVGKRPRDAAFRSELELELSRFEAFLD